MLKKNFLYSFMLNIFNIAFPLITSPYVSRKLGADNLGKYSFAMSLSTWFMIFASFGISSYGIREIAKVKDNDEELNRVFSELFTINFISTLISVVIYLGFIFTNSKTSKEIILYLVVGVLLILNIFSMDWFFAGMEKYRYITIRSFIFKLICLISIFIFIKGRNDYIIYGLISVMALSFANILNYRYSKKFVKLRINKLDIKKHINKLWVFFLSSLIISMYTQFDQIFLGLFSTNKAVAFYNRSRQIYSIALSVTMSISTVLIPRLSFLYENNFPRYQVLLKKSLDYIYIFSIPSAFGLMLLSKDIMYFFGGREFLQAYMSMSIVSVLVFVVSIGTWQYNQLFIPLGYEKIGLKNQLLMAVISLSLNAILVPRLSYIGASITIVVTEVVGTLVAVYYSKVKIKKVKVEYLTKSLYKYLIASAFMSFSIFIIEYFKFSYLENILLSLAVCPIIYFGTLLVIKEEISAEVVNIISGKLKFLFVKENSNV
ncbi:MAG: flippase [Bacillota bacterium]|nr:flippase [Bacillota bacterium]